MQEWIIELMNQFGYLGILVLVAVENVFPPIPSEIILTFGGFMTGTTRMDVWGVVAVSTIGSIIGALVLYWVGRMLTPERLERLTAGKIGRALRFKQGDIEKANRWFQKRGKLTVLFCRCIPIVRSLISIPAGIARMNLWLFLAYTTLGSLVWNTVLVLLGAAAGASWQNVAHLVDTFSWIVLLILALGILGGGIWFFHKRRKKKPTEQELRIK